MLLFVLVFNVKLYAGLTVSDDGRIRIEFDDELGPIEGLPQYSVGGGDPITLPVPSGYTGYSRRISGDGTIISGQLYNINENGIWIDWKAAVWQQLEVIDDIPMYFDAFLLPSLEEWMPNKMYDMSPNGEYIVGHSHVGRPERRQAVYWDEYGDVYSLGSMYYDSLLYDFSSAYGVSNYKIIVGEASGENTPSLLGFIWDEEHGMRYIKEVLEQQFGYDFGDSVLESVYYMSPDGTIINGSGYTPTGDPFFWSATIPEPATILFLAFGIAFLRKRPCRHISKRTLPTLA